MDNNTAIKVLIDAEERKLLPSVPEPSVNISEESKPLWYDSAENREQISFELEHTSGHTFDVICNLEEDIKCLKEPPEYAKDLRVSEEDVFYKAQEYYYRHLCLCPTQHHYMWDQSSPVYRQCFLTIARLELEDDLLEKEFMNGQ